MGVVDGIRQVLGAVPEWAWGGLGAGAAFTAGLLAEPFKIALVRAYDRHRIRVVLYRDVALWFIAINNGYMGVRFVKAASEFSKRADEYRVSTGRPPGAPLAEELADFRDEQAISVMRRLGTDKVDYYFEHQRDVLYSMREWSHLELLYKTVRMMRGAAVDSCEIHEQFEGMYAAITGGGFDLPTLRKAIKKSGAPQKHVALALKALASAT